MEICIIIIIVKLVDIPENVNLPLVMILEKQKGYSSHLLLCDSFLFNWRFQNVLNTV